MPQRATRALPPAPAPRQADSGFDIKGTLDKLLAASDGADRRQAARHHHVQTIRQAHRARARPQGDRKLLCRAQLCAAVDPSTAGSTARAKAVIARLKDAAADGLDAADYPVPDFGSFTGAEALADGDIKLTDSVLTFARHLAVGRIAPTRVLAEVDYGDHTPEPADILRKIADAADANAALDSFNPPHEGFRALKGKLAELRSSAKRAEQPTIASPTAADQAGRQGRARADAARATARPPAKSRTISLYDRKLYNAIRYAPAQRRLQADRRHRQPARSPPSTGPSRGQQIDRVLANMERWRWLPRDLGATYVMVNIPDFTLKVVHDHRVAWRTKIVAGKPQTPTPLLTASMDNVLVNPSWYVPQSIIQNELLPLYASDPNIFDRMGLEVKRGPDGNINVVQPPGAANALGRIKFNFPNKFQVYLHDTPEKRLFAADKRAFSHGCMRVEDPTKFGEIMLHLAMNGPTPNSRQL